MAGKVAHLSAVNLLLAMASMVRCRTIRLRLLAPQPIRIMELMVLTPIVALRLLMLVISAP